VIGQTCSDYQLILATSARITTIFWRNRIPSEDESLAYQLRIDLEVPPELESECERGLITEAMQRVGTEILGGIRGPDQTQSGENRQSVMTNVVRLMVCYHSSREAIRVLLDEIMAQRLPPQNVVVSTNGGDWHSCSSLRTAQAA
jgi:hypothetical protein